MTNRDTPKGIDGYLETLRVEPPLRLELVRPFHAMLCDGVLVVDARYLVPCEFGGASGIRLSVDVLDLVELHLAIEKAFRGHATHT